MEAMGLIQKQTRQGPCDICLVAYGLRVIGQMSLLHAKGLPELDLIGPDLWHAYGTQILIIGLWRLPNIALCRWKGGTTSPQGFIVASNSMDAAVVAIHARHYGADITSGPGT
eukprot:scaffold647951_cov52-Prasinocladus_malaysianus.AAC.1